MISENLKRLKFSKKLSIKRLSELSGVAPDTISKIMSGTTQFPAPDTMQRLADALDCTVSDLTGSPQRETNERIEELHQSIQRLQTRLYQERKEKIYLAVVLTAVLALIAVMIVIDFCNPNIGWRRW